MADPDDFDGNDNRERLKSVVARWRTSLVDLSGRNRLLNYRHTTAATLEITQPSALDLVNGLEKGWEFATLPDQAQEGERSTVPAATGKRTGIFTQKTTAPALNRALGNLRRRSTQVFNDYGIWTLQLGVGMLNWRDDGSETGSDAPLILFPVDLELMPNGRIRLVLNESEEPKLNPALPVKLEQFHIDWSSVAENDPSDIDGVLRSAAKCVASKNDWTVKDRVVLALFASHKESMYQDLLANESSVLSSDLVKAIALGPGAKLAPERFDFDAIPLSRIDELAPPEDGPLVLDADASQRQAVAAAVQGRSFVMDGPPGTGKSQTIANMIAGLIHAGRTVLFVSEKAAALDVVLDRLKTVGLDSFALAIHSKSTSRSAVAKELGRALDEQPHATRLGQRTKEEAQRAREALTEYADAMNEVRAPLDRTLHDVIGRISILSEAMVAYTDSSNLGVQFRSDELTSHRLASIVEATELLAICWVAVADPNFPWRNVRRDSTGVLSKLTQANAALHALTDAADRYRNLTGGALALENEGDIEHLLRLLELVASRIEGPLWWLTSENFLDDVEGQVDRYLSELHEVRSAHEVVLESVGVHWKELPTRLSVEPSDAESALGAMVPPAVDLLELSETEASRIAKEFGDLAVRLNRTQTDIDSLANYLGLEAPSDIRGAVALCEVASLAQAPHRPLAHWFSPDGLIAAKNEAVSLTAERLEGFFNKLDRTREVISAASMLAGQNWRQLDRSLSAEPSIGEVALGELRPSGLELTERTGKQAAHLTDLLENLPTVLSEADELASKLAGKLCCPEPECLDDAVVLVELVESSSGADRALPNWFVPDLRNVHEAARTICEAHDRLDFFRTQAESVFLPSIVDLSDLPVVIKRLEEGSRGFTAFFSRQLRADRKTIAEHTVAGSWNKELYTKLSLAVEWHSAFHGLRGLCESASSMLGRFVNVETAEVHRDALRCALDHADGLHRLVPDVMQNASAAAKLSEWLGDGRMLDSVLDEESRRLKYLLNTWRRALSSEDLTEPAHELAGMSLGQASYWVAVHLDPLESTRSFINTVTATIGRFGADSRERTLKAVRDALSSAHIAQDALSEFERNEQIDRKLLGTWYAGLDTSFDGIDQASGDGSDMSSALIRDAVELACRTDGFEREKNSARIGFLGDFAPLGNPDTRALSGALDVLVTLARIEPVAFGDRERQRALAAVLADEAEPAGDLPARVDALLNGLKDWERSVARLDLGSTREELLRRPAGVAAHWLHAHLEPLGEAEEMIRTVAKVRGISGSTMTLASARTAVAAVTKTRHVEAEFAGRREDHRSVLGRLEDGLDTAPARIRSAIEWTKSARRVGSRGTTAALDERLAEFIHEADSDGLLERHLEDWRRTRTTLLDCFKPKRRSELKQELAKSLANATQALDLLASDPYGPDTWIESLDAKDTLDKYRLGELPGQLASRGVRDADFPAAVERAVLVAWVENHLEIDKRLAPHKGLERDKLVERFRGLDRQLVEAAHAEVIAACNSRRPKKRNAGQPAIVSREAEKQRRHMPVRQLLGATRETAKLLKPCFMMSPLTVSQFLPSDFRFDVVIFDEASQVLPQDAINSIYRGNALVVAGDARQLPPTAFFGAATDNDDDDDWDEDEAGFESVLDSCKASGLLPALPLRWHYRSRHENLIAFSNHEFYDNSMITFPGAHEGGEDIGVKFIKVNGVYDRGGRRDNQIEADQVAQRVIHHFRTRPHLTLGVVALSKTQADAIEAAVEKACEAHPGLARFFTDNRLDGFFVKNLETVQGDERDVIILSIGYGPDAEGRLRSEFGPINRDGGWRRLNVAVTRARRRMEVVASFRGGELPDSGNKSVQHLKRYLEYAEHGPNVLATQTSDPEAVPESPFEESVLEVLKGWGYSVQPQVGVGGYRIDMAVRDPDAPGTYAIGIECDGAMYHSSRAARDRDRLREAVLQDLGWKLHRIWGTDWYRNRAEAMTRLRAAIDSACAQDPHAPRRHRVELEDNIAPGVRPAEEEEVESAAPTRTVEFVQIEESASEWVKEYRHLSDDELWEVRMRAARQARRQWVELQETDSTEVIAAVVLEVLDSEGPIVEELICTRVRTAWRLAKSGAVIQARVRTVVQLLVEHRKIVQCGSAYDLPGHAATEVRTQTSTCKRKIGQVPEAERQFALRRVVEECPGMSRSELVREVSRVFGWTRTGRDINTALSRDLDKLLEDDILLEEGEGIRPSSGNAL